MEKSNVLYVFVGARGVTTSNTGAWNGGGLKGTEYSDGSGGGATDIRSKIGLTSSQLSSWGNDWNNSYGLKSRIIIAAGGGGADDTAKSKIKEGYSLKVCSSGGGLSSTSATHSENSSIYNTGATQTSGGYFNTTAQPNTGPFGSGNQTAYGTNAGGGGGYWGGAASDFVGMGGSSYISGHPGCVAIASATSTSPSTAGTENSVTRATHYSGLCFTATKMIDGAGYAWTTSKGSLEAMPNPSGGYYSSGIGRSGNGYAKISSQ